jgi:site-specific DNA-methyltransferase (adenine-specific)
VPHGKLFDYWIENNVITSERDHPTEKPEGYIEYLMQAGCPSSGLVLDPFLGSGTTAYCAKKLNRKCIGIEIEERYCEIAAKRCSQGVFNLGI